MTRAQRVLAKVPGWKNRRARVTPLKGGITNENFRVDVRGKSFVLRLGGSGAKALGIDRRREAACSRAAARLGIGPAVTAFLPRERAMVARFLPGKPVTARQASSARFLRRLAAVLRRVHGGPRFPGRFSPFETVRLYRRRARARGVRLPASAFRALRTLALIESVLGPARRPKPCHNDLLGGNILDDGKKLRVLDWEYAAMGDPFFDLGNFAVNMSLSDRACARLLKEYAGRAEDRELARLHLYKLASDMREAFWGFLQKGLSDLRFDFTAYGTRHLNRFLLRARGPRFKRLLREAL